MTYELLDNISRADIAYRVRGNNPVDLFLNGAGALVAIMLENPASVLPVESVTFSLTSPDLELLYFDYLSEFIFFKDSQKLILLPVHVEIHHPGELYALTCVATGEHINRARHIFNTDIKAITLHKLSVLKTDNEWHATVVVDV